MYDCITVNGFELWLPLKLSIQLRNIKDFVFNKKIVNKENLDIDMVIAKGKIVVKDGKASIKATFE